MKAEQTRQVTTQAEESARNAGEAAMGAEADVTARMRTKAELEQDSGLMEVVCEYDNLKLAYRRVVENKGAAGVDGIGVAAFKDHLKQHWPTIKAKLLAGEYMPSAVRRVDIAKPQGGTRTRHSNADGSHDPASVASGAVTNLRSGVLGLELRLPTGKERSSSG